MGGFGKLFAHIETGICLDLQPGVDEADYLKRFSMLDTSAWQVKSVPDDTCPFAKWNGDGTVTNPQPAPIPQPPPATTKQKILDQILVLQTLANNLP